jgi:Protein of unknown function (DUF3667)
MGRQCANCGTLAPGAYCPSCGQDTRDRLPTFAQFMREATGRYVALDGKLWKTLVALLFRPGFLTREYLAGRRRRYIGPARLFLVSSLVLFAALRFVSESINIDDAVRFEPESAPRSGMESDPLIALDDDLNLKLADLPGTYGLLQKPIARFNSLPRAEKLEQIRAGALRYGPYAVFALLPAFAGLQKLLYLGRRRRYPARPRLYGEHLVFAAHNHAFLFVVGTLLCGVPAGWMRGALWLWVIVYLAWSTRAVYGGSWTGIAARATVLVIAYSILFGLVTAALMIAAILLR